MLPQYFTAVLLFPFAGVDIIDIFYLEETLSWTVCEWIFDYCRSSRLFGKYGVDVDVSYAAYNFMVPLHGIFTGTDYVHESILPVFSGIGFIVTRTVLSICKKIAGGRNRIRRKNVIKIENVSLVYGSSVLLKEINMELKDHQIYGFVGNNGSGKTMLMKCMVGFVKPTEGRIWVDGKCIGKDIDFMQDTGIIIETPGFIPYYSGLKNLELLAGLKSKTERAVIQKTMERCGLDPALKLSVRKYSLGMRQRLGIAQAIMESPKYLILDEPLNGLDKTGAEQMREVLLGMAKDGVTIVMSSHNEKDIAVLCDKVYEIEHGCIL